jgi:hypothetical protein
MIDAFDLPVDHPQDTEEDGGTSCPICDAVLEWLFCPEEERA